MDKNSLEEQLRAIFTNVNEWLKFAEAKNAAIIAADAAAAFGAISVLAGNFANLKYWFYLYLHLFIFFVMCSAIAALISVIPHTSVLISIPKNPPDPSNDNLLFYGHIAKYSPQNYLIALQERFGNVDIAASGLNLNYAQQIVMNSQITFRKYKFFRWSAWLAVTAILTPVGAGILFVLANKKYEDWLLKWKKIRKSDNNIIKEKIKKPKTE